ncbi:MAG: hypothetical protein GON13_03975 [Nanoarchaeota archaeon]|nr:hypothetical protein [Nanoarchaeota archaeon]
MLLKELLREEWRMHSTMFGNTNFILFSLVIFGLCALFALITPLFISSKSILSFSHYLFFALGISIGSFGLSGREVLNKRFGEISFIAYSSKILPVSVKQIFLNFALKDLMYYTFFFIIPFCTAFIISSAITTITITQASLMFITIPLTFFFGLSLSFLMTTIYSRSKIIIQLIIGCSIVYVFLNLGFFTQEIVYENMLPPLQLFFNPTMKMLIVNITLSAGLFLISTLLFNFEFKAKGKGHKTLFRASKKPSAIKAFMLKDFIDLHRSQGGFGKILFSFLIPILIIEVMMSFVLKIFSVSGEGLLILFSVIIGVTASTIYNWLAEFDNAKKYLNLPINPKKICLSKTGLSIILGIISGSGLLIISFLFSEASITSLGFSFIIFTSVFAITLSVLVYLTGLNPNTLLFDAKTFLKYMLTLAPIIVFFMLQAFSYSKINHLFLIPAPIILTTISIALFKKSMKKITIFE